MAWLRPLLLTLILATAAPVTAQEAPREIGGPVDARVVKVRDGDTVEVAAFVWPQHTIEIAVRLRGIDAPELRGGCEAERRAATVARDRLKALIGNGPVKLRRISGDKYFGRVLADLSSGPVADVGATLLAEGLVDAYDGGKRRDWCAAFGAALPTARSPDRS